MIPILYERTEQTFSRNGLGRLSDAIRTQVFEERNGIFELEMDYPVTGAHFDEIEIGRIIGATHNEDGDIQPFDIYAHTKPIDGIVTFYGRHISYRLAEAVVTPFKITGAYSLNNIWSNIVSHSNPAIGWSFQTDINAQHTDYTLGVIKSAKQLLGGSEGSMLDLFGGEWEWNIFSAKLHASRGKDNGVSIRYGKNLVDYEDEEDISESYNGIYPYWLGTDEDTDADIFIAPAAPVLYPAKPSHGRDVIVPMDMSGEFEGQPTSSQLTTLATQYISNNTTWDSKKTVEVDFVQLWQTEEYAQYTTLMRCGLCDTVHVSFPMYNVSEVPYKVVKVEWNVLQDRYDKMTLGSLSTSFADVIEAGEVDKFTKLENRINQMQLEVVEYSAELPNTFASDTFRVVKYGRIVEISIGNVTKAAVGNNALFTLPVGWRPKVNAALVIPVPSSTTASGYLRLTVSNAGAVAVYNYKSSAVSSSTNASAVLTYIAEQ